jgi:hypothetical protein
VKRSGQSPRPSAAPGKQSGVLRSFLLLAAIAVLAGAALPAPATAQQPADDGGRLVYVFSIDGLDGDRVDQGRAPFLGRLLLGQEQSRATYYRESRSVMVAETNPNHVAMATGAFGDRSGIPGNAFAVYGAAARQACGADDDGTTDGETPTCMVAESFFTAAKRLAGDRITTAGIFGKPKLADIFATRRIDPKAYDADFLWSPCNPQTPTPYCDPNAPARPNDGYAVTDSEVMDVVVRSVDQGVDAGGARRRPNLTFVNLPTVDSAGHGAGTTSGAYDQAIAQADEQLSRFVANQKAKGLWERTVMFVVSDHSMDTTLGKTSLMQRFGTAGLSDGVIVSQNGSVDMVYLENRSDPGRFAKLKQLREAALSGSGVDEALYREPNPADGGVAHTLDFVHPAWRIAGDRTGDLLVTHELEGAFSDPVNPLVGNHGSPETSDNTFAVIGGAGVVRQQTVGGTVGPRFDDALLNPGSAQNVDVAPTVMALLGLDAPGQSEGRVLTEAFEAGVFASSSGAAAGSAAGTSGTERCAVTSAFRAVRVRPRGRRGLRVAFSSRRRGARVRVDVFRLSTGRSVLGNRRVARFSRSRSFTWSGARGGDGTYLVRVRSGGDVRRFVLVRRRGRFRVRPVSERRASCGLLRSFKLERPVFGGRSNRALGITFRVGTEARVFVEVLRGRRVVRRFRPTSRRPGVTHRLRLASEGLRRSDHRIRLTVTAGGRRVVASLVSRRL